MKEKQYLSAQFTAFFDAYRFVSNLVYISILNSLIYLKVAIFMELSEVQRDNIGKFCNHLSPYMLRSIRVRCLNRKETAGLSESF